MYLFIYVNQSFIKEKIQKIESLKSQTYKLYSNNNHWSHFISCFYKNHKYKSWLNIIIFLL